MILLILNNDEVASAYFATLIFSTKSRQKGKSYFKAKSDYKFFWMVIVDQGKAQKLNSLNRLDSAASSERYLEENAKADQQKCQFNLFLEQLILNWSLFCYAMHFMKKQSF